MKSSFAICENCILYRCPTATWPPLGRRFGEVSRSRRS
ncbi:hypothetical protein L838_3271 [Mycobacterium avium MAV_120709_2344]|nr:hypothetical protein L838_3271 [Mycobacterium avium MAV_120709_2344]